MTTLRQSFRRWWRPPRRASDRDEDRSVTFLELFYDFMTMGIAAAGAAVLNVVELAGEPLSAEVRWLLVGAIALALVSIALLMRTIQLPEQSRPMYWTGGIVTFISGLFILLLGFTGLVPFHKTDIEFLGLTPEAGISGKSRLVV